MAWTHSPSQWLFLELICCVSETINTSIHPTSSLGCWLVCSDLEERGASGSALQEYAYDTNTTSTPILQPEG